MVATPPLNNEWLISTSVDCWLWGLKRFGTKNNLTFPP